MLNECFAFNGEKCTILTETQRSCGTKGCPFHKTEEEKKESEARAKKRCEVSGYTYGETRG